MTTDYKNKTPFLLGLLFLALATTHEIEHIAEAFEIEDETFEINCDYCEESQSQDLVNSETNITFIDFDIIRFKAFFSKNHSGTIVRKIT